MRAPSGIGLFFGACALTLGALTACAGEPAAGLPSTTPVAATPTPAATPSQVPVYHKELSGVGSTLTETFEIPSGKYRVSWEVKPNSQYGDYLNVNLIGESTTMVVYGIVGNGNPTKGSTLFESAGGKFAVEVKINSPWWVTFDSLQ